MPGKKRYAVDTVHIFNATSNKIMQKSIDLREGKSRAGKITTTAYVTAPQIVQAKKRSLAELLILIVNKFPFDLFRSQKPPATNEQAETRCHRQSYHRANFINHTTPCETSQEHTTDGHKLVVTLYYPPAKVE